MFDKIEAVRQQHHLVTRTEAARLIMVRGLESLGIDLSDVAEEGASETKDLVERIVIEGEKTCKKAKV